MRILRWALAGASVYVIYKYSIGKVGQGEDVFESPDASLQGGKPARRKARPVKRTAR